MVYYDTVTHKYLDKNTMPCMLYRVHVYTTWHPRTAACISQHGTVLSHDGNMLIDMDTHEMWKMWKRWT